MKNCFGERESKLIVGVTPNTKITSLYKETSGKEKKGWKKSRRLPDSREKRPVKK